MHKLEITGATPEDLFMNAVRMLSVLLKGGAAAPPAEPAQTGGKSAPVPLTPSGADKRSEPLADEKTTVLPPKTRRGAKSKNELNDEIPDLAATTTIERKALTLDGDIRPRLRAIQKAHTERGNDMPACVAFIQKLYGPFNITKADQLKAEHFAEFLEASEAYLAGTVEC